MGGAAVLHPHLHAQQTSECEASRVPTTPLYCATPLRDAEGQSRPKRGPEANVGILTACRCPSSARDAGETRVTSTDSARAKPPNVTFRVSRATAQRIFTARLRPEEVRSHCHTVSFNLGQMPSMHPRTCPGPCRAPCALEHVCRWR